MALPEFSMRQLLEAGVHFGHQSHRWNPKMAEYIFGVRNNIHIIDLAQTVPQLHRALQAVSDVVAKGGRVLFVGTKRQAQDSIADAAKRSAQYFVNSRWLGGTLTNWKTISGSIKRLRHLDEVLNSAEGTQYTKKERLTLQRERDKLDRSLGGIKDMGGLPDLIFVIDTNKEDIAIQEAQRLNIPVAAIVDTNCDPKGITYLVPGNDDAGRAITLYCDLIARAVIDGISRSQGASGVDVGASAAAGAGSAAGGQEARIPGPAGTARRRRRSEEAHRRVGCDREEPERHGHLPLLAACRARPRHGAPHRRRSRPAGPRRQLGGAGEDARRSRVDLQQILRPDRASGRISCNRILMPQRPVAIYGASARDGQKEDRQWRRSPLRWSRNCATRPAQA